MRTKSPMRTINSANNLMRCKLDQWDLRPLLWPAAVRHAMPLRRFADPLLELTSSRQILHVLREERAHLGRHRQRGLRHARGIGTAFPARHEAEGLLGF